MAHGDDAQYLAKLNYKGKPFVESEEDKKMVDIYQKLIGNFIRCEYYLFKHQIF